MLSGIVLMLPRWANEVMEEYIEEAGEVSRDEAIKGWFIVLSAAVAVTWFLNSLV